MELLLKSEVIVWWVGIDSINWPIISLPSGWNQPCISISMQQALHHMEIQTTMQDITNLHNKCVSSKLRNFTIAPVKFNIKKLISCCFVHLDLAL